MTDTTISSPLRVRTRTPKRAPKPHVADARTMAPGPLGKKYQEVAKAYKTVRRRAAPAGLWGFQGLNEFLASLGPPPSPEHSVERISRTGCYAPGNVRWASPKEQANNRSTNRLLTIDGETLSVEQWSERTGVPAATIRKRLSRPGWSEREAVYGRGAIDPSPSESQKPSLIPAPPGWEAPLMQNGRPLPYLPRLDQKYADRSEFPLDNWPWPEHLRDHTEKSFQFECKAGRRRIDHLLIQLGIYITRIEARCDAYLGHVQTTITQSRRGPPLSPSCPPTWPRRLDACTGGSVPADQAGLACAVPDPRPHGASALHTRGGGDRGGWRHQGKAGRF